MIYCYNKKKGCNPMSKDTLLYALNIYRIDAQFEDNKYNQTERDAINNLIENCESMLYQTDITCSDILNQNNFVLSKAINCAIAHLNNEHDCQDAERIKELRRYSEILKSLISNKRDY